MDELIENVVMGRQLSRETCWASAVEVVGKSVHPEIGTNAAALIVAEGIIPNIAKGDNDSQRKYDAEKTKDPDVADELISKNPAPKKETRDPVKMLEKHFKVIAINEEFKTDNYAGRADVLRTIIETVQQGYPLILGITPTAPLQRRSVSVEREVPVSPTHVLVCHGVTGIGSIEPNVVCQDPAAPNGARTLTVPISRLLDGFVYIEKENLGSRFRAEFSNENVSMRLSRVIRTTNHKPG